MPTLYQQAESNIHKTWLLISLFFGFVIMLGWLFSRVYGSPEILFFAVMFSSAMSIASYWWSDRIVLALHQARPIEKKDNPEFYRIVENLALTMGLPMPRLFMLPSHALNAFATGRDPAHGVVAVTEGIMRTLEKSELEGVLAHEMSHIGNRDTLVSTVVAILAGLVVLLADWFFRFSFFGGRGRRDREGGGSAGIIFLALGILFALLAPLAAQMIQFAVSRRREFLADAAGALVTRYPEGLARALEKISYAPKLEMASNATAHLYIASPLAGRDGRVSWFAKLFMTHPPIEERIAALRGIKI
ncbi:MAG: M48 family metallopeptidase [bacterium]|nr:M48 family metallopeptidase [bacterium]